MTRSIGMAATACVAAIAAILAACFDDEPAASRNGPLVAFGGDVILANRANALVAARGPRDALGSVAPLAGADLAIVNLETVIAPVGGRAVDKGSGRPYYFRARPEHVAVLTEAGVDVVLTANNHSGDFGAHAQLAQLALLDATGLGHAGSGADVEAACRATLHRAGDLVVAVFGVDATRPSFAAGPHHPGTCHAARDGEWMQRFATRIREVRRAAHVVLVGIHVGREQAARPERAKRAIARALIDAGADAVLGSSAHVLQGVEIYRGRPIIYDAGNLYVPDPVWPNQPDKYESAVFGLRLAAEGVTEVVVWPVVVDYGRTAPATGPRDEAILGRFVERSAELGTRFTVDGGRGVAAMPAAPRRPPPDQSPPRPPERIPMPPPPLGEPPVECLAEAVPLESRIAPIAFGPLRLIGVTLEPPAPGRGLRWLHTFWIVEAPPARDYWLHPTVRPSASPGASPAFSEDEHEPCDWMWPTTRWIPGRIYHDVVGVRSVPADGGDVAVFLTVRDRGEPIAPEHEIVDW